MSLSYHLKTLPPLRRTISAITEENPPLDFLALNFSNRNSKNLSRSADERVVATQVIVTPTEKTETIIIQNVLS